MEEQPMTTLSRRIFAASLVAVMTAGLTMAAVAAEAPTKMQIKMTGKEEVPPNDSKANGTVDLAYDPATKQVTWSIKTEGLSSPAMAAHIHGPAAAGANAGVVVNLAPNGTAEPINGSATLTEAQAKDLLDGKYYVNVHTQKNPGGEIRGQITPSKTTP
jgi:hypothetical protein